MDGWTSTALQNTFFVVSTKCSDPWVLKFVVSKTTGNVNHEIHVHVDFVISLITELTADDLRLTTVMLVQTVQANPLSPLDKIKSINTDDIHVTIYKGNSIQLIHPTVKSLLILGF
jgi:hypothetical protein